ncbi:MAG: hypothetical protein HQM09_13930 [Candidatus Riflebacteria bacterium]|nr:hypothetical protein [Candidatus Riflebacteria bacterium]
MLRAIPVSNFGRSFSGSTKFFRPQKSGFVLLIIMFLLLLAASSAGYIYWTGIKSYERLDAAVQTGYAAIEKDQADAAIASFRKAVQEDGIPLQFFRKIKTYRATETISPMDVRQALASTLIMKAYTGMMELKPASTETTEAVAVAALVPAPEGDELRKIAQTARDVSELCDKFQKKQFEPLMKSLLQVEKRAARTDQDFVLMEIRLMIAVGKALQEQLILTRARELLYFLSFEAGIKNSRTDRLWKLLNQ